MQDYAALSAQFTSPEQWLHERFGVYGCVTQLFAKSDLTQNVAVVAVADGVDHLWTLTA